MVKNRRKKVIIVVVLAAFLCAVVIFLNGIRKEPETALLRIMSDRVDLQVRNVHYTEVGDSGMKWEVIADTAQYLKKENMALFDKVTVKLVMKDGKSFVMTGDKGRFNTESRDIEIQGNVHTVSDNGDRFTTDHLHYRNAEKQIETDGAVVMENETVRVNGVGMIFSLEGQKVALLSQVRAISKGGTRARK